MRRIRRPRVRVEIVTDDNTFTLRFEDTKDYTGEQFGAKLLGFQTKNAMEDDSAVFQVTLAGDTYWDKLVMANDIIRIYIMPNDDPSDKEGQQERLIQVGMVSQVSKVGSYGQDQSQFRITGNSFIKPFMKFGLGVIQEVQAVAPEAGWLIDGEGENEVKFVGSSAHEIMTGIIRRFIPYMKYNYTEDTYNTIDNYLDYENLESWDEFEKLTDASMFTNFDGSLKQFMDSVTARPFNELFFKNSEKTPGKAQLVMRKTPFNPTEWRALDIIKVPTEDFIEEDVGKSDVETYSIFTATPSGMLKELSPDVFSKPQFHPELTDRYGYTKFEVENIYLGTKAGGATEDSDTAGDDAGTEIGTYAKLKKDLDNYGRDVISKGKDKYTKALSGKYKNLKKAQAKKIIDKYVKDGTLTEEYYEEVTGNTVSEESDLDNRPSLTRTKLEGIMEDAFKEDKDFTDKERKEKAKKKAKKEMTEKYKYGNKTHAEKFIDKYIEYKGNVPDGTYAEYFEAIEGVSNIASETGTDASSNPLNMFSKMLFNWYHSNPNFYAGDIIVLGDPKYDLGKRLFIEDRQRGDTWEFYIEAIEHKFDYKQGYYTTVGVTRGLKDANIENGEGSPHRFKGLWNQSSDFMGGLMGEEKSSELKKKGVDEKKSSGDGDSSGGDSGGAQDGGSLDSLKQYNGKLPKHDPSFVQPNNRHYKYQCTWYVYNRRGQLKIPVPLWGDAADWIAPAKSAGYGVGKTPKQGACVIWQRGDKGGSNQYGHVAFVEKVLDGGKKIFISEHNWDVTNGYGTRTISMSEQIGKEAQFIYDKK